MNIYVQGDWELICSGGKRKECRRSQVYKDISSQFDSREGANTTTDVHDS